jgi:PmbA protein
MTMDIMRHLKPQAEQVEVVRIESEATNIIFEANKLKSSQVQETTGVAVRVVKNGRLGFAASSDMAAMDRLVSNALESATYGDVTTMRFPGPQPLPAVTTFDKAIRDMSTASLVEMGQAIIALVRDAQPDASVGVQIERGVQSLSVRNQAGTKASSLRSPLSIGVDATRIRGDDVLIAWEVSAMTVWQPDYLAPVRKLRDKLKLADESAMATSGKMPVLFAPGGVPVLAFPIIEGLSGKNVYTGISPLAGKVGEKLFDSKLTVADDATLDGAFASAPVDDEGVPHRRTVLIEQGVLKGFFYDLKTAAQAGVETTGNGSRGLFSQPAPAPTNLVFGGGDTPLAEIIAGIDNGLLVQDVLGLGQGNVISGAFSNPLALGYKIEKGKIVGRVKGVSIAGNVYELLRNVILSRETEWVYGNLKLPHILVPEMNVVVKE